MVDEPKPNEITYRVREAKTVIIEPDPPKMQPRPPKPAAEPEAKE